MTLNPKRWHTPQWAAFFTLPGAVATAVGAYLLVQQIGAAQQALFGGNAYLIEKDLIDALDRLNEAKAKQLHVDKPANADEQAKADAELDNAAWHLDNVIEAAAGLKDNKGISDDIWNSFLRTVCNPLAAANYRNRRRFR